MTNFKHPGDTNHPIEFGFDIENNTDDAQKWAVITGESVAVVNLTDDEVVQVQTLIDQGRSREVAIQTVQYERLG